jgi:hypothetical protein
MNDMAHRRVQVECGRRHRIARLARPDRRARLGQPRSGRPVDRPVHTAATQQGLVGGGDDGVHVLHGDVTEHHVDISHGPSMPPHPGLGK